MRDQLNNDIDNRLVSLSEAANAYGFSADYLRNLAQKGRLKAHKIGGIWLTTSAYIEAYIESRQKRGVFRADIRSEK